MGSVECWKEVILELINQNSPCLGGFSSCHGRVGFEENTQEEQLSFDKIYTEFSP